MDETELQYVLEAALLAAGRPLSLEQLTALVEKRANVDRTIVRRSLENLASSYEGRGIELKEVASGYRIQVRRQMADWLVPLWEERPPRYSRALLETLALIAYRQPITRGEIEEIRGVAVGTNIVRTLQERSWVRVVGHRDVPGKPAMFGTTREFLDYFGLKRLEDLPPLSEIKDLADADAKLPFPELHPQGDIVELLTARAELQGEVAPDFEGKSNPTSSTLEPPTSEEGEIEIPPLDTGTDAGFGIAPTSDDGDSDIDTGMNDDNSDELVEPGTEHDAPEESLAQETVERR